MPETPQYIPLSRAYLCADCAAVGNNSQVCPACASKVLQNLARVLDWPAPTRKEGGDAQCQIHSHA